MDLRAEPMVLSVPAVEKSRYYSVMLCDGNTYNYGYIGSRATGMKLAITWWSGPTGKARLPPASRKCSGPATQFSLAAYRTQLFNPEDMPNVVKVQAGYKVQPLSEFLNQPAPPAAPAINFPKINKEMVKTGFFDYLDFALQFAPAGPEEKEIRAKLARLGIDAGKNFDFKTSRQNKRRHGLGHEGRRSKIEQYLEAGTKDINGWKVGSLFGDAAFYQWRLAEARRRR